MAVDSGHRLQGSPSPRQDWVDDDPTVELGEPSPAVPATVSPVVQGAASGKPGADEVARFVAHDEPLAVGRVLRHRYRLEEAIGCGGQSMVYRARDLRCAAADTDGAGVAIKTLRPEFVHSEAAVERFQAEFRALRSLSHPAILRVFDLDRDGFIWFQVMELLQGQSLAALLRDPSALTITTPEKLESLSRCAEALVAAHDQGTTHGDIKPGNIFLTSSGDVRLLDFGAATGGGDRILATPAYASPQVLSGAQPEAGDDVFSFACVAFEWLTGGHPFEHLSALEAQRRGLRPSDATGLDPRLAAALRQGLAWDRSLRPATIREFLGLMRQPDGVSAQPAAGTGAQLAAGTAAQPAAGPAAQPQPDGRHRLALAWLAAPALLVVGLLAGGLLAVLKPSPPAAPPPEARPPVAAQQPAPLAAAEVGGGLETDAGSAVAAAEPPAVDIAEAVPRGTVDVTPVQRFAFETDAVTVSHAASAAALRVWREGPPTGRALVSWRLIEGTALAGRDFSGPTSGTLSFADGQTMSTLFVPLVTGAAGDTTFTVELTKLPQRAGDSAVSRVNVSIRRMLPSGAGPG
jgi:hypothetical protein